MKGADIPVAVVILCRNEAHNLPRCIERLRSFRQCLVIDDRSEDGSVDVAKSLGAEVVAHRFNSFADQRNAAMQFIDPSIDWVLHLDADEVLEPEAAAEVADHVSTMRPDQIGFFARKVMLGDRWLRYSADYPVYVPRLIHRDGPRFFMRGHGEWIAAREDASVYFKIPFRHYSFSRGWDDWWARHRRYAAAEARRIVDGRSRIGWASLWRGDSTSRRAVIRAISYRLPGRPLMRFLYSYVLRGGFRDGPEGWAFARAMAGYERLIDLEVERLRSVPPCALS